MSRPLALALFLLALGAPGNAAVHVWTGASSDRFSDAGNWRGGSPAGDPAAELSFPAGAARLAVTNDLSLTVKTIAFSGAGYVLTGNAITLAADAEVQDTTDGPNAIVLDLQLTGGVTFLTQNNLLGLADGVTVSGAIGGHGPLTKLGSGRLTFTGARANTYSRETRVLNGELRLGKTDGVNAVAGEIVVGTTGVNYEYGRLETLTSEQIPDVAKITVRAFARFHAAAVETVGPMEVEGAADIGTFHGYSGNSSGTMILAGDIEVVGDSSNDVRFYGDFALAGIRTVTILGNTQLGLSELREHTPGSGLIVRRRGEAGSVEIGRATYYGPTIVESGYVSVNNPNTPVRLRGGTITGSMASLVAEAGILDATSFSDNIRIAGDLRLSGATKVRVRLGGTNPKITAGGTIDLRRATLELAPASYSASQVIIANNGPGPILGTFFDTPEGHIILNRYRVSYKGGDGNDVTLTDVGRDPTTTTVSAISWKVFLGESVTLTATVSSPAFVDAGNVTFRKGEQVIGTVPVRMRTASLTFQPPFGSHRYTVTYEGTKDLAPSMTHIDIVVMSLPPLITSVTPETFAAGTTVDVVLHGRGFLPDGKVDTEFERLTPTSVTDTEVRFRWNVPRFDEERTTTLLYRQPDGAGSNPVRVTVKGASSPTRLGFEQRAVTGPVVPGGSAAWLSVGVRDRGGALQFEHRVAVTPDSNRDGVARWEQTQDVAPWGLWLMTDMTDRTILSGTRSGNAPPPDEFPRAMFLRDANGNYSHGMLARATDSATDLLWVRAGVGAWYLSVEDGAPNDLDGAQNGIAVFNVSQMQPVDAPPASPAGVQPGDVFLGLDYTFLGGSFLMAWFGDRVDDHLRESDGPGILRLAAPQFGNAQESAGSAVVRVLRTGGTDGTVSVDYRTEDDTAKSGVQYEGRAGRLTFGPGEILKTIEIPLIDNAAYSGDAMFNVVLSRAAGTSVDGSGILTIRIRENDPAPRLTAPGISVTEGDEGERTVQLPVTLSAAISAPVTARWSWGNDLGTLTFVPGGPLTQTITVRYDGNRVPQENRTIAVQIFDIRNATPDRVFSGVTVVDDDFAEITILDATVNESKTSVNVIVAVTAGSYKRISVRYATANGSAAADEDFTAKSGTLEFDSTASRREIAIPIAADTRAEGDEWFTVVLSEVRNATLRRAAATVVIADDDAAARPLPSFHVAPVFVTEGTHPYAATFRLRLSSPAPTDVYVRISTAAGTATQEDFVPKSELVGIVKDAEDLYIRIEVLNDSVAEGPETFSIVLSEPVGATIATPTATATIFDDDDVRQDPNAATVTVSGTTVSEGNAGNAPARFTVQLSRALAVAVTVPFATADAGAVAPADYVPVSGTLTFAPGETTKTIEVPVIGDRDHEADETFTLVLGTATNAWTTTRAATARILNDDAETPARRRSARH